MAQPFQVQARRHNGTDSYGCDSAEGALRVGEMMSLTATAGVFIVTPDGEATSLRDFRDRFHRGDFFLDDTTPPAGPAR